jgi:hypothetical protein
VTAPDGRVWEIYVSRFKVVRPALRMIARLPLTIVEGMRAEELRVEAISFLPWTESHLWITTKDHLARVVEQIAAGLAAGDVARPLGAEFRGSQEMVGGKYRGLNRDG